jgi:hypothetical protein
MYTAGLCCRECKLSSFPFTDEYSIIKEASILN